MLRIRIETTGGLDGLNVVGLGEKFWVTIGLVAVAESLNILLGFPTDRSGFGYNSAE